MILTKNNIIQSSFRTYMNIWIPIFIIIVTTITYREVINHDFLKFDDNFYVTENNVVLNGINLKSILWAFDLSPKEGKFYWHPVTWISHMIDCQIFGLNPSMHHMVNLAYHIANSLLIFLFFQILKQSIWKSAFIAAVFALHPLNVESVAWISERKNVLSTFLWMLTLISYLYYRKKVNIFRYLILTFFFVMGLLAKPMLVTLPCVMLLIDFWPLHRNEKKNILPFNGQKWIKLILEKIPLLTLSFLSIYFSNVSLSKKDIIVTTQTIPMFLRIENAFVSYVKYIGKILYPQKLAVFYPFPKYIPNWQTIGAILILMIGVIVVLLKIRNKPYLAFGYFWFIGTLVPVSGIIQTGLWPELADRWAYIPSIGILVIITWGGADLINKFHLKKYILIIGSTIVLIALHLLTLQQVSYWKNDKTLFNHALACTSSNYIAHTYLANYFFNNNQLSDAIYHFSESIKINPQYYEAQTGLGISYIKAKKYDKAIYHLKISEKINPQFISTINYLGMTYIYKGEIEKSIPYLKKATELNPENAGLLSNLGMAESLIGNKKSAVEYYQKAIKINPNSFEAYNNIGKDLIPLNRTKEAIEYLKKAIHMNPKFSKGYFNLGSAYLKQNNYTKAEEYFKKAVNLSPNNKRYQSTLEKTNEDIKEIDDKIITVINLLKNNQNDPELYYNLGLLMLKKGNIANAIKNFQKSIQIDPRFEKASYHLLLLYIDQNEFDMGIAILKQLIKNKEDNLIYYYNIACIYAMQKKIDQSAEWLSKAIERGYRNIEKIKNDNDLKNLRNTKLYRQLIQKYFPNS